MFFFIYYFLFSIKTSNVSIIFQTHHSFSNDDHGHFPHVSPISLVSVAEFNHALGRLWEVSAPAALP